MHKPRYTPSHPRENTKKPKQPSNIKARKEGLKEVSNSGYSPHIMENPIDRKSNSIKQVKPSKLSKPLVIHSPPRTTYSTIPDSRPAQNIEKISSPELRSNSPDVNVHVVNLAIEKMEQEQLKTLIDLMICRYEHRN